MERNHNMVSLRHLTQRLFHLLRNSGDDCIATWKIEGVHRGDGGRVQIDFARKESFGIRKTRGEGKCLDLDAMKAGVCQKRTQFTFAAESKDILYRRHAE